MKRVDERRKATTRLGKREVRVKSGIKYYFWQ